MLQTLIACLIGSSLALMCNLAVAKEYEIEIIVFDRLDKQISADEQWDFSSDRIAASLRQMTQLGSKVSDRETTEEIVRLKSVRTSLIESGYRILNTTSWQQPTSVYQDAPLIPLGNSDTALADNPLVAGFVRVYTTSLIYADLNLQLSPPTPLLQSPQMVSTLTNSYPVAETGPEQPHYFIAEKRRLKFTELHYFDHPFFGAILGVWLAEEE